MSEVLEDPRTRSTSYDHHTNEDSRADLYFFTGRVRLYTCDTAGSLARERTHTLSVGKRWAEAIDDLAAAYQGWDHWELEATDESVVVGVRRRVREAGLRFRGVLSGHIYTPDHERDKFSEEIVTAAYGASRLIGSATRDLHSWQTRIGGGRIRERSAARPFCDVRLTHRLRSLNDLRDEFREQVVKFRGSVTRSEAPAGAWVGSTGEIRSIREEVCLASRRVVQLLHCLLCLGPSLVSPAAVSEILRLYERAVPLMPEGNALRMSVVHRHKRLQELFPSLDTADPKQYFAEYRKQALTPDPCGEAE